MRFNFIESGGNEVLSLLAELRLEYPQSKKYPFIIGDEIELETLKEAVKVESFRPSQIIAESLEINAENWFASRKKSFNENPFGEETEFDDEDLIEEWFSQSNYKPGISAHKDILTGETKPKVFLGLIEIAEPWMLPAETNFGNWNECPPPQVQCALMRSWQQRYGAEIVSMSHDIIECKVSKPPATETEATALAWEQYLYCSDIVDQGCQTIENLAATLINSDYWYFWWD